MEYLSYEKQFERILNREEIERIEDLELRSIRSKYWGKVYEAHMDEHGIPDSEIGNVYKRIKAAEQAEIEEYKKRKGLE